MTPGIGDKCLVCARTGGNLNIFTTFNIYNDKEELYVEVIKNCFNIEISPETGLSAMCTECSTKLRKAYTFKNNIIEALQNLVALQVTETNTNQKEYTETEYLNQFENDYDINTVLNPETGQITYTLDKIDDNVDTTENEQETYLIDLENDVISKKDSNTEVIESDTNVVKENIPENFENKNGKPRVKKAKIIRLGKDLGKTVEVVNKDVSNIDEEKVDFTETKTKTRKKRSINKPPFTLEPGQTECNICHVKYETRASLSRHMNGHFPEHTCGECGQVFTSRRRLKMHGYQTHVGGPITCKHCDKEFTNVNTRNAHMWRVHTKADPFKCAKCGERFKTYLKRLRHMESTHGDTVKYPCDYCDKVFAYAAYRTKHVRTVHQQLRPHKCTHCNYSFGRRRELSAHLASKHGEGEQKYQCDVCSKKFYFKTALRFHLNLHENRYSCNQCDAKFSRISQLEAHYKTHDFNDVAPEIMPGLDSVSLQLEELTDYAIMDSFLILNEM